MVFMVSRKKIDSRIKGEQPIGDLETELNRLFSMFPYIHTIIVCKGKYGSPSREPRIYHAEPIKTGVLARGEGGPGTRGYQPLNITFEGSNGEFFQRTDAVMEYLKEHYS